MSNSPPDRGKNLANKSPGPHEAVQPAAGNPDSEFVSRISHELRGPINTILGFGELLSAGELAAEQREWASMLLQAARHLASFMDDLSDIAHGQARRLSLAIEAMPASEVITEALNVARPLAVSHGVHLVPAPRTGQHVTADRQRLRQVLINLLSNAITYNHPAGQVAVAVRSRAGRLRVSVSDTGRGIAAEDLRRLFVPFQRLDAAQAGIAGRGLGLSLSRQLIEAMGGTAGARSEPGVGSVFWVELPLAARPAAATLTVGGSAATTVAYRTPKTVLYIEDMVETLRLVEQMLRYRPSIGLVPAMLGGVALDLAAEHHPDLILLDLDLPDMPGEELLRRLKADPATSAVPVVIISADADPGRIERALRTRADAYLTKPLSVRMLLSTVDSMLTKAEPAAGAETGAAGGRPGSSSRPAPDPRDRHQPG